MSPAEHWQRYEALLEQWGPGETLMAPQQYQLLAHRYLGHSTVGTSHPDYIAADEALAEVDRLRSAGAQDPDIYMHIKTALDRAAKTVR